MQEPLFVCRITDRGRRVAKDVATPPIGREDIQPFKPCFQARELLIRDVRGYGRSARGAAKRESYQPEVGIEEAEPFIDTHGFVAADLVQFAGALFAKLSVDIA